jgi:ribosomal protein L12E/L44/L45/RPP1/RPP2
MKMTTLSEAQKYLPELVKQAQVEAIGLTDEEGTLIGLLAGVSEDDLDDLLVQTPGFRAMIAASRASLQSGEPVSAQELLAEARAEIGKKRKR